MTQIIDIILHKNKYYTQTMIVVDEKPDIKYERVGDLLIGEDSGFFNFYKYERPTRNGKAFAGREFSIQLVDGSIETACGQWWDHVPSDYKGLIYTLGVSTIPQLEACNVFSSMSVDKEIVDTWLTNNEPSNNYYKYDLKSKAYGIHKIVSKW